MTGFRVREHAPGILVAALGSAFGVALLQLTGVLATIIAADDVTGSSGTVRLMLGIVAIVFIVISTYVSAIVTANTFATIIAGRTREIALLRVIGASARSIRRSVAREGLLVGLGGAITGAVVGALAVVAGTSVGVASGVIPSLDFAHVDAVSLLPVAAVVVTTWLASWVGSRRVLTVSPIEATGGAVERPFEQYARRRGRNAVAITLFGTGTALLVLGMLIGLVSPLGVLVGVVGGVLSFTGVVLGSHMVMPRALRAIGRMLGGSAEARLAAENAVRHPERSARTTIGLVIGVTLVTMFAVTVESFRAIMHAAQEAQPDVYQGTDAVLTTVTLVFSSLIGFSAVIAAVGMVNNLSLSVLQRARELGLLRALGFTGRQLRGMIRAEAAQLVVASLLVGLALGTFYGWAGAQSLLGALDGVPGLVLPVVPWWLLVIVAGVAGLLTVVASSAPARRASRVSPVVALAAP